MVMAQASDTHPRLYEVRHEIRAYRCAYAAILWAMELLFSRQARPTRSAMPRPRGFVHRATLRNHSRNTIGELSDILVFTLTLDNYDQLQWSHT